MIYSEMQMHDMSSLCVVCACVVVGGGGMLWYVCCTLLNIYITNIHEETEILGCIMFIFFGRIMYIVYFPQHIGVKRWRMYTLDWPITSHVTQKRCHYDTTTFWFRWLFFLHVIFLLRLSMVLCYFFSHGVAGFSNLLLFCLVDSFC